MTSMSMPGSLAHQEIVFYQDKSVLITNTRVVVLETMYPVRGITSVSTVSIPPNRKIPAGVVMLGLFLSFLGIWLGVVDFVLTGIPIFSLGVLWLWLQKMTYAIRIFTAGGQLDVLVSQDQSYVITVVQALHGAVAAR